MVHRIIFLDGSAVDVKNVVMDLHMISTQGDSALQENLLRVERIMEGHNFSAMHPLEPWQPPVGKRNLGAVERLIPEKMVSHKNRAFHGSCGHQRSLANEDAYQGEC